MPGQAPALTNEKDLLLAYVAQQRDGLRYAAYGLTDEQARLTPTTSTLSIGGLLKHIVDMERTWAEMIDPTVAAGEESSYEEGFTMRSDETLADLLGRYDAVAKLTEQVVGAVGLDHEVPVPRDVPWFPDDVEAWSVRWILLHLIEETARHAGHADIIRESIDGATMYPLMAGAEGWPETDWMKPWKPPS